MDSVCTRFTHYNSKYFCQDNHEHILMDVANDIVFSLFFLAGHSASGFWALVIDQYNHYQCQSNRVVEEDHTPVVISQPNAATTYTVAPCSSTIIWERLAYSHGIGSTLGYTIQRVVLIGTYQLGHYWCEHWSRIGSSCDKLPNEASFSIVEVTTHIGFCRYCQLGKPADLPWSGPTPIFTWILLWWRKCDFPSD